MGTYLSFCWSGHGREECMSVMKVSAYPMALWYDQATIPDGNSPTNLETNYLPKYRTWLQHLEFIAAKLPDTYLALNTGRGMDIAQLRAEIEADLEAIDKAALQWSICARHGIPCHLSVG